MPTLKTLLFRFQEFIFFCLLWSFCACQPTSDKEKTKEDEMAIKEEKKEEPTFEIKKNEETPIQDTASLVDKDFAQKTLEEKKTDSKTNTKKNNTENSTKDPTNIENNIKTPKKYDKIHAFHFGRAVVVLDGKFGYIDTKGHEITPIKYDFAEDFTGLYNLARVRIHDKVGFVDLNGNEVVPLKYRYVEKFYNGLAHARMIDGEQFYIDKHGNHVCDILDAYHEGVARVKLGKKIGYVDTEGNVVVPIKYDYGTHFHQGMADVKLADKHFFINKKGECVKDCPNQ